MFGCRSFRTLLLALAATVLAAAAPVAAQQREPVLRQIQVPHHYYYREMYLPQVTSGPSAATWSPDGAELIYSMQGSLWRQRLGDTTAYQLTAGDGYDYQPEWSPAAGGRWVVYSSYRNDALELRLLDLSNGATRPLVADGQVHLDARFAPDGTRLAWVSTTFNGRWHIYTAPFDPTTGTLGPAGRITEDRDSGLPRYYYSTWDHYLSPTWSPDGRELILVSNRGRIWGTGGFWRMPAQPDAPMREIWYEETTWKARPDWAPDGRRVVYSGYHGRQWNQLWLMTADGGDPFQLTYGEFDATAPRWSPDGRRIAFISNQHGNTSLRIVEIPGGRQTEMVATDRRYRGPMGRLRLLVTDDDGRPISARLSVFEPTGRSWAPDGAWRHGDELFVRNPRQFEYNYFHADSTVELALPPGVYTVEAWKGPEYTVGRAQVTVAPGQVERQTVALDRLLDLPRFGWWGGDLHVHMNYGGHYRNTPARLRAQAEAEGLHVVENLIVNKEQRIPDIAYWQPGPDPVSTDRFLLMHAEEFHTSFWGHTALLGLSEYFVLPNYAGYVNTGAASLVPMNADVFAMAREQGAITGYVHPFDSRPDPYDRSAPVRYELPVDAALGLVDYFEVMGFSDHLVTSEFWYRLLNNGFRIAAGAGTDAFPNYASLRGPPGLVRVYARTGGPLEHRSFLDAIRAGRTFVTNGPLLGLGVRADRSPRGRRPATDTLGWYGIGDDVALPRGRHQVQVQVSLRSNTPMDHLEVVQNGQVVRSIPLRGDRTMVDTLITVPVDRSGWIVLRARAGHPAEPILDLYPFASTSPVWFTVDGAPVRSAEDARYFVVWLDRVREEVERHDGWNTPEERAAVLDRIARAQAVFVARGGGG